MKVKDRVKVIRLTPITKKYLKYFKKSARKVIGMKGRVIQILINSRHEEQGARVRFRGGWCWSFYFDELELRR